MNEGQIQAYTNLQPLAHAGASHIGYGWTRLQSIGVATSLQELFSSCATTRVWQSTLNERRAHHEQGW
jgi:hypothetical protein